MYLFIHVNQTVLFVVAQPAFFPRHVQ